MSSTRNAIDYLTVGPGRQPLLIKVNGGNFTIYLHNKDIDKAKFVELQIKYNQGTATWRTTNVIIQDKTPINTPDETFHDGQKLKRFKIIVSSNLLSDLTKTGTGPPDGDGQLFLNFDPVQFVYDVTINTIHFDSHSPSSSDQADDSDASEKSEDDSPETPIPLG